MELKYVQHGHYGVQFGKGKRGTHFELYVHVCVCT